MHREAACVRGPEIGQPRSAVGLEASAVSQHNADVPGARERDVGAPGVRDETEVVVFVRAGRGDDNGVGLAALRGVDRGDEHPTDGGIAELALDEGALGVVEAQNSNATRVVAAMRHERFDHRATTAVASKALESEAPSRVSA